MKHQNIALEVIKKLLNDEIRARTKKNFVQSKPLMEMLEDSIKRYHIKVITAAEIIEELIKLAKEIQNIDKVSKELGLSNYEYTFYTAVANHKDVKGLMKKEKLRELAVVLTEEIKQKAPIDWTIKENVRSELRVAVKEVLKEFGYPPNMKELATDAVLKQAELIESELTSE